MGKLPAAIDRALKPLRVKRKYLAVYQLAIYQRERHRMVKCDPHGADIGHRLLAFEADALSEGGALAA